MTSHFELPKILNTSFISGIDVFLLKILVFNNLKSTTGLLSFVSFLVINITGDVWLVLFLDKIPKDTNLSICVSINSLSVSLKGKGLTKRGNSSITCISAVRLGHAPISSLKLNASLYFIIIFINLAFSLDVRWDLDKSIFSYKICVSNWNLHGSSGASQGIRVCVVPKISPFSRYSWQSIVLFRFIPNYLSILSLHNGTD